MKNTVECEICKKDEDGNYIDLCVICNKVCCDDCMNNGICVRCDKNL